MHKKDWQKLSITRLIEAKALFLAKSYPGAYYLSGHVIESALKAVIAKNIKACTIPEKNIMKCIESSGHNINELLNIANLTIKQREFAHANPKFQTYWNIVTIWKIDCRYRFSSNQEAKALLEAIEDPKDGILTWVKQYW